MAGTSQLKSVAQAHRKRFQWAEAPIFIQLCRVISVGTTIPILIVIASKCCADVFTINAQLWATLNHFVSLMFSPPAHINPAPDELLVGS